MRTLFVTRMLYPNVGGVPLRNRQNMTIMQKFGKVGLFSVAQQDLDSQTPEPIEALELWHHHNIAKLQSVGEQIERKVWWLRQLGGLSYCWPYLSTAALELDKILTIFKPDLVVIEELWLYHYMLAVQHHPCPIIVDEHNVEAQLFQETRCSEQTFKSWVRSKIYLPRIKAIERSCIEQADQVWLCSEEDRLRLQTWYDTTVNSFIIPNGIDWDYYDCVRSAQYLSPRELNPQNNYLLFLGTLSYEPNREAVQLLIEQIYPRLQAVLPTCCLLLVGREPTSGMLQAAERDPGIIVAGDVPDVRPYLAAANLMVVPLFKGGGTRLKILEAFAAGCPVVSTAKGAEGLKVNDGEQLLIRDNIESFCQGVLQLLTDSALENRLVHTAYELVQSEYTWDAIARQVKFALQNLAVC